MKIMVLVKASADSEAGKMPTEQHMRDMMKFNEELVKAGVLLAGEGLHPSSRATRIYYEGASRRVVDGPFSETKELVAGFWILQVKSREEAVEWLKRAPFLPGDQVELRTILSADDFAAADPTGEIRAKEAELRKISEGRS